jgi:hypothetical protein
MGREDLERTWHRWARRRGCVGAVLCVTLGFVSRVSAQESSEDEMRACAKAYEGAQEHRLVGELLAARQDLLQCREERCREFISHACTDWLAEVNASMSTVTFDVRQGERVMTEFGVLDNGARLFVSQEGDPVELDPGVHLFELQLRGEKPLQKRVVLQPMEKNRLVRVLFPTAARVASPAASQTRTSSSPWPYVLGGVGGLGLSGFAVLGLWGTSREDDLRRDCAPNCSEGRISSVRGQYLAADISLGVGVVALSVGAYLWLSGPDRSPGTAVGRWRLGVSRSPYGAAAQLQRSF